MSGRHGSIVLQWHYHRDNNEVVEFSILHQDTILVDPADVHKDLEARATCGATILTNIDRSLP